MLPKIGVNLRFLKNKLEPSSYTLHPLKKSRIQAILNLSGSMAT
ncbi:MAG: hypothetical protein P8X74_06120 [Reinekea sp.]